MASFFGKRMYARRKKQPQGLWLGIEQLERRAVLNGDVPNGGDAPGEFVGTLGTAVYQGLASATQFNFTELLNSQESFLTYFRQGDDRGEFFYDAQAATLRSSGPYELARFQVGRRWTEIQFEIKVSALSFGSFNVQLTNGTNQYVIKLDGALAVGPNWRTVRIAYDEVTRTLNAFIDGVQSKQASVVATNWNSSFDCTLASGGGQNAIITLRNARVTSLTPYPPTIINKPPTDIALSATSIPENTGTNAAVGTLTTTDVDVGNTFTYTLVTGTGSTDNATFTISVGQLLAASSFNFEAKSSYSVRVRSTDQGGLFTEKQFTITVTNVNETPGTPTGVTVVGGGGQVSLSWTAPRFAGDTAITDYVVKYSSNGGSTWTTFRDPVSTATSCTVTGLTRGTSYVIKVIAKNAVGVSLPSANSAPVTPATVAGSPTSVLAVSGNTSLAVTWTAPASTGGSAITDYLVKYSANNGSTWTNFVRPVSTATSCTVTGLTRGTSYVIKVIAKNAVGVSLPSANSAPAVPLAAAKPGQSFRK